MDKPVRQIAILAGVVYFIQGALGVAGVALPLYLRSLDWTVSQIAAVSSLAAWPWVFKIIYGLISDSFPIFGYRRKPYLMICSLCSSLGWLCLVILPPSMRWIAFSMSLSNFGFAAVDVVTDGLIVEYSRGPLNSFFQSIAWGCRSAGALLSGVLGGWLASHWNPHSIFLLTMVFPLFGLIAAALVRESKHERMPFRSIWEPLHRCLTLIKSHSMRWYLLVLVTLAVGSSFGMPFFFFMRENLGFQETFLGLLSSLGWGSAMCGSFFYFRFLRKVKPGQVLQAAIMINAANIITSLFISKMWTAILLVSVGGIMGCISMLTVMTASAAVSHRSGVEGTFFAILMGIFNAAQILFGYFGGKAYECVGLYPLILVTALIALSGVLFVRRVKIFPRQYLS